jgi:hypothetical protein
MVSYNMAATKREGVVVYHMVNIEGEYENTFISSVFLFGMTHI